MWSYDGSRSIAKPACWFGWMVLDSADRAAAVRQGDVKDTLKDAGSNIKDKVSGAADDAEDAAKSGSAYLAIFFFCSCACYIHRRAIIRCARCYSAHACTL